MSRRKQPRPRPVKALVQSDNYRVGTRRKGESDYDHGSDIFENPDVAGMTSKPDNIDAQPNIKLTSSTASHIAQLVCPAESFPRTSPNVSQTSTLSISNSTCATSSAASNMSYREESRCERFPKHMSESQEDISVLNLKLDKCKFCSVLMQDGTCLKTVLEGKDYFIDSDGTLAIRNGVCPRSLALSLFSQVLTHRSKYTRLLGENMFKFLLNLKQIIMKQRERCPGESSTDFINAENVLRNFSFMKKEFCDITNGYEEFELLDKFKMEEVSNSEASEKDIASSNIPHKSINGSSHRVALLNDIHPFKARDLISVLSELPSSEPEHISSPDTKNSKSEVSDTGSIESLSRVNSPSSSMSSVHSGPSLSDRTKEMVSTKRGCKILPVASTDGQTHYPCPVCNLELSSDHELTIHIRSHNQSGQQSTPNTCTICGKTLSSQSSLDRHMLVHSGERPFKCKICDMSFTTNGNMHRHARIHEKNGISTPKSTSRKSIQHKAPSKEDIPFHEDKSASGLIYQKHQSASIASDLISDKMNLTNSAQLQEQNAFLHPYYRLLFPYNPTHHPAFPYPQLLQYPTRVTLPIFQTGVDPLAGESLAEYIRFTSSLSRLVREPSPDLRVQQTLQCTVCKTAFSNQFSLESHMESHILVDEQLEAESGSACKSCKTVAKSEASLLLHSLKHHKVKNEDAEPDTNPSEKCASLSPLPATTLSSLSTCGSSINSNTMGFQNLGFVNFTTKKFPLIAKAFCESHPSTRAVRLPVYKCKDCDQEFPVEGAKHLHEASHVPEEYTMCPQCNCHFSEPTRLQEHMQKHVADLKFEESLEQMYLEPNKFMLQYHFLAQFGLTPKEGMDQTSTKNDGENVDNYLKEKSVDSHGENNKVIHTDESNSELCQTVNIHSDTKEQKADNSEISLQTRELRDTAILNSKTSSSNTMLLPSFRIPQGSEDFLSSTLKCSSLSAGGDPGFNVNYSSVKVSPVSTLPMLHCKYCNIKVTSPKALKYHLYTHKNTSQFQCKVCNYSSTDKNTLLRHMRIHSGERPYKCAICEYSFTTKANCERHLRQKHGLEKNQASDKLVCNKYIGLLTNKHRQSSVTPSISVSNKDDHLNWRGLLQQNNSPECQMDYICKKCMKTHPSRSSLLQHIRIHHPQIQPFEMGNCIAPANVPTDIKLNSPPHAHLKSPVPSSIALKFSLLDKMAVKQELNPMGPLDNTTRPASENLSAHLDLLLNNENKMGETDLEKPLDFSKQQAQKVSLAQREEITFEHKSISLTEETFESAPIDLSFPRITHSSQFVKAQDHDSNKQRCQNLLTAAGQKFRCDNSFLADIDVEDGVDDKVDSLCAHKTAMVSSKSPTESNSSCEFASVNRILNVTDAQNFQNFLHVPETEDEQEIYISESASSDEDSSISSGHYHSQTLPCNKDHLNARPATATVWKKRNDRTDVTFTDPANMSEQAVAELIERVSQENGISPAKKKKNSYADSPHKFACPFCPRCFPWASSLNRHLLTHTGQKPFKCPQCPVIFSTKSNRERHLTRKHNVNMLDPASRSTMDRPYKCHICMFSSFSTHNNLIKHYKDKHSGVNAPTRGSGVDKSLDDSEWEDGSLNGGGTSYEDEEEYNSLVEMHGGVSDMEVMFENYAQDSDSNHSTNYSALHDPHKKQNSILNFKINESHKISYRNKNSDNSSNINIQSLYENTLSVTNDGMSTDTLKNYQDKNVQIAVDDRQRNTVEGSSITSETECHKQSFPNSENVDGLSVKCFTCDKTFSSHAVLTRHQKGHHLDLSFQCSFCECRFITRLECLQHFEQIHQEAWAVLKEKNEIGNIQVFSTRLDKIVDKHWKKEQKINAKNSDKQDEEQNYGSNRKSLIRNDSKSSINNNNQGDWTKDSAGLLEKQTEVNHDTKTNKQKTTSSDIQDTLSNDCLFSEVYCALCPERLKSLQDLRTHMNSHIGMTKVSSNNLKSTIKSKLMSLSTPGSTQKSFSSATYTERNNIGANGNHVDMLHDLLGVASSTIDQIFESSDSAANLLGVSL